MTTSFDEAKAIELYWKHKTEMLKLPKQLEHVRKQYTTGENIGGWSIYRRTQGRGREVHMLPPEKSSKKLKR